MQFEIALHVSQKRPFTKAPHAIMKLLPFTEYNRQQLLQQGYTHISLLRSIAATDREYNNSRDYFLYEAVKPVENMADAYTHLTSDEVTSLITNDNIDCYIMLKK